MVSKNFQQAVKKEIVLRSAHLPILVPFVDTLFLPSKIKTAKRKSLVGA
jgi:hypothetical protein